MTTPNYGIEAARSGKRAVKRGSEEMAHEESVKPAAGAKLVIRNIGVLLSGDFERPILDADTIVAKDGRILAIGKEKELDTEGATRVIDANSNTLAPGLIDSHVHPVAGDWTPRQNQLGWIDSCLHGGVTTMISAGEVHTPGRPKDVLGLKAMAITAQRAFAALRPSGVKVLAGAPVIEQGMVEEDFRSLAEAGVQLLGEVGLGSVKDGPTAHQMVAWARRHGMQSTIHTGGPSIPGSSLIDKDVVLAADADVIGHINGGHTALPDAQIRALCEESSRALEIVHNGNERAALFTLRTAKELKQLHRVILGTDAPAGSGVQPLGILRVIAALSSMGEIPAEVAFCFATGNTARMRSLDRGLIEVGRAADFVFMDAAQHSAGKTLLESVRLGDLPGIGMVVIDGEVKCERSRNTPPATRMPKIQK
jgi:enamidase